MPEPHASYVAACGQRCPSLTRVIRRYGRLVGPATASPAASRTNVLELGAEPQPGPVGQQVGEGRRLLARDGILRPPCRHRLVPSPPPPPGHPPPPRRGDPP